MRLPSTGANWLSPRNLHVERRAGEGSARAYLLSISISFPYRYISAYIHISIYVENKAGVWPAPGRPECIYLSIWTRATTAASADSSASSIYPYIYIRGEQGMAADSASSTET